MQIKYCWFIVLFWGCMSCSDSSSPKNDEAERSNILQQLGSLGYVNIVPVDNSKKEKVGVTLHDRYRAFNGVNLYNSREQSNAKLIDMEGREVHRWASGIKGRAYERMLEMLPHYIAPWNHGWAHFEMAENGDLIVMGSHHMLARLDWHSRVVWKLDIAAHHDFKILKNGDIVVLVDKLRRIEIDDTPTLFLDNEIVFITHDGQVKRKISLFDALGDTMRTQLLKDKIAAVNEQPFAERFQDIIDSFGTPESQDEKEMAKVLHLYDRALAGTLGDDEEMLTLLLHNQKEDVFHSNSIQELDRTIPGLWRAGDLLICIRDHDTIAVIDHESERVIWSWGAADLQRPHHATYLADGTILIFDNGSLRHYSRIIKLYPATKKIVWEYMADPPKDFFSATRGGCQEQPNGNILIAESNKGRAFEITPAGEIVWEYFSEFTDGGNKVKERGAIYRMQRLALRFVEPLLKDKTP